MICVDEDDDSEEAFEIGLDKANKSKHKYKNVYYNEDSDDSFSR